MIMKQEEKPTKDKSVKKRRVLGRGLGALLDKSGQQAQTMASVNSVQEIDLSLIETNPYQPRTILKKRR